MILRRTSLAALLDVAPDELLRVLLEDLVDLVKELVDAFQQFALRPLDALGGGVRTRLTAIARLR
jgi:hypothetical protein